MSGPGQWVERSGEWVWDENAPARDDTPTYIGGAYRPGVAVSITPSSTAPAASSPRVLDPSIGADGGGHPDVTPLPVFDPASGEQDSSPAQARPAAPGIAVCGTCGTAVSPDRLRS